MSNLPGKITDPHLSAEEPLTFRRCLRFILQALLAGLRLRSYHQNYRILFSFLLAISPPHPRHPLRRRHFHLHPDRQAPRPTITLRNNPHRALPPRGNSAAQSQSMQHPSSSGLHPIAHCRSAATALRTTNRRRHSYPLRPLRRFCAVKLLCSAKHLHRAIHLPLCFSMFHGFLARSRASIRSAAENCYSGIHFRR